MLSYVHQLLRRTNDSVTGEGIHFLSSSLLFLSNLFWLLVPWGEIWKLHKQARIHWEPDLLVAHAT
jgi:hypothetical protein